MNHGQPPSPAQIAAQLMALELLHDLLASTVYGQLPERLAEMLREFTGAGTVLLVLHDERHRVFVAHPARRADLLGELELAELCPFHGTGALDAEDKRDWLAFRTDPPPGARWRNLLCLPLVAARIPLAQLVLADLPQPERMLEVADTFELLLPAIAMALKNALDHLRTEQFAAELERRVAERTAELLLLNRELEQFKTIFDTANFGALITDPEGILRYVNPAFAGMHGYLVEELTGAPLRRLYTEHQYAEVRPLLLQLALGDSFSAREVDQVRKDGRELALMMTACPVRDAEGRIFCFAGSAIDITDRKQLEAQFRQAQKMESVGRLAGGVAHDFNNMLGAILGNVEFALDSVPEGQLRDDLLEIQRAAQRSADLTRQLLAFARQQAVSPQVLDLNEMVTGMLKMLQRLIGESIELVWIPGEALDRVKMDPSQIDQILANCCVNARDAITGVGRIIIETDNVTILPSYQESHVDAEPGDYVRLSISDNGQGMEKRVRDHLFEPFYTTKKLGQGTGLGLATVYGIVRQNGGFINVYSEPGLGSTFRIYFPRVEGDFSTPANPETRPAAPRAREGETLLIVEDEPAILSMTQKICVNLGYRVLAAGRVSDAIELFGNSGEKIHLLITDVIMPESTGRDLYRRLSAADGHLRCLYMSGYTANVIAHHGVLDPGVYFIQKPFTSFDLATRIRAILDAASLQTEP